MSEQAQEVLRQRLNIDLLPHVVDGNIQGVGIRVRPYGKGANTDVMVLGYGPTVEEALEDVFYKAHDGRWERLDWAARPWGGPQPTTSPGIWGG